MSRKDKNVMPQSTAGLIRYFDQTKQSIKIKAEHVLIAAGGFIVIELLIKFI